MEFLIEKYIEFLYISLHIPRLTASSRYRMRGGDSVAGKPFEMCEIVHRIEGPVTELSVSVGDQKPKEARKASPPGPETH